VLGYVLLGLAVLRSTLLPRRAGLALLVSALLFALPVPPALVIVNTVGAVLFGLGYIWLGYVLSADTGKDVGVEARFKPVA
jgi:hypothetical protein